MIYFINELSKNYFTKEKLIYMDAVNELIYRFLFFIFKGSIFSKIKLAAEFSSFVFSWYSFKFICVGFLSKEFIK